MDTDEVWIRGYRPDDLDDLYRICLRTADSGQDATSLFRDPRLPGHVFAAPYGVFEPELAFVAEDAAGVGGYIVGALDSQAFESRLESEWWPPLRGHYPEPPPEPQTSDQRIAHHIHHPLRTPDELAQRYPSHLHINLVPRLQGRGQGRLLMNTLIEALRGRGSRGVHLHVSAGNQRAAAFYPHLGFARLPGSDARVFGLELAR
jgi:ribosomal protein S18 acetylase RimI-like enzyme